MAAPQVRRTRQRDLVLEAVRKSNDHPTARQVYTRVRRRRPKIAFATIYNALRWWVELGELQEFTFGGAAARYDRNCERHDHAICTGCGKLRDIEVADVTLPPKLLQQIRRRTGLTVTSHHVQFIGLCGNCTKQDRK